MEHINPESNVVIMNALSLRDSKAPRLLQPYDSHKARNNRQFSSPSRILEGECASNMYHGDSVFRVRDLEKSRTIEQSVPFRQTNPQLRPFSQCDAMSAQRDPPMSPTHYDSRPNIKTRPTPKGSYGVAGTLLQKKEFQHPDENFERTDKMIFKANQEGIRYADVSPKSSKFPPMKPSNLIVGNQHFEHHNAYLSAGERESPKRRSASGTQPWRPANGPLPRILDTFGPYPATGADGYEEQDHERALTQLGITNGFRRETLAAEKTMSLHSSPFRSVPMGTNPFPQSGVQTFSMHRS